MSYLSEFEVVVTFFVLVLTYWISAHQYRSAVLVIASLLFAVNINSSFGFFVALHCLIAYLVAQFIVYFPNQKKAILYLFIFCELGLLVAVKYLKILDGGLGINVGISFILFRLFSYIAEVYKGELLSSQKVVKVFAYLTYFPQILSGPIEKYSDFYKKIETKKKWKEIPFQKLFYFFTIGLFKKKVLVSYLMQVSQVGLRVPAEDPIFLIVSIFTYVVILYLDFSAYCDFSSAVSLLFGFSTIENFNLPFFSRSVAEFYKRWHISFNDWLTQYIYFPLFFTFSSKLKFFKKTKSRLLFSGLISLCIVKLFFVFWHGVYFGCFLAGGLVIAVQLVEYNSELKNKKNKKESFLNDSIRLISTYFLTSLICFLLVRLRDADSAYAYITGLYYLDYVFHWKNITPTILICVSLFAFHFIQFNKKDRYFILKSNFLIKSSFFVIIYFLYMQFGVSGYSPFIYFQF